MPQDKFGKAITSLLRLVALGVLAENIVIVRENRRLRDIIAPEITAGTQLRMLSGLALDGRAEAVEFPSADSKLLVITFSPGCPACQANQEGWTKLAGVLERKGVRVLWMSRDAIDITRDYCSKHGIPISDALADPPYRTYAQLGLARVPNTVLVGAGGTVEKVWAGRLDSAGWNRLFLYFGERQLAEAPAHSPTGAVAAGCAPAVSDSSKSCK